MEQHYVKVNEKNVEIYKDSQKETKVTRGKVVFLITNTHSSVVILREKGRGILLNKKEEPIGSYSEFHYEGINPIIISENEKIEIGDNVYDAYRKTLLECNGDSDLDFFGLTPKRYSKILVNTDGFTEKHLSAICMGKIKENSYVLLEIKVLKHSLNWDSVNGLTPTNIINFTKKGKVTLLKPKKTYHDIYGEFLQTHVQMSSSGDFLAWLETYYNVPTEIK